MTTQQKANAYDEAFKVIKSNLDALNEITTTGAETVNIQAIKNCFYRAFPELKESEDERIRKWIYNCIDSLGYPADEDAEKELEEMQPLALAWLEKQKEQKPAQWNEEDEKKRNLLIEILKVNHPNGYFKVNPANTLNMEAMHVEELVNWLTALPPQPKVEWSKEDERMLRLIINAFRNGAMSTIGQEQWLKSLPERFNLQPQTQPKQEQQPTAKLTGWVARDKECDPYFRLGLILFKECKPQRSGNCWNGTIALQLPWESFPDLKWEDEPVEVEVTIKKK